MKHLKTYKIFEAAQRVGLTAEQEEFLNKYTYGAWSYNTETGLVDVDGNFDFRRKGVGDFRGVKFGHVLGYFNCSSNGLTSLVGAPRRVGGSFHCNDNEITSLEGAPREIGLNFNCTKNKITSLEGAPQKVGGYFDCSNNQITSLEGVQERIKTGFACRNNRLTTLEGGPKFVGGNYNCNGNDLASLAGAPEELLSGFGCYAFGLMVGEWNLDGWLSVLKTGTLEAKQLILTILTPEMLNQEIEEDPEGVMMKLKPVWNDEVFSETRSKLVWPKGYEQEADLLGDLDDVGF